MPCLMLSLFGSTGILLDDEPITRLTSKTQALLYYLAVESAHPHRRSALAGLLWPEQPEEAARNGLRQALHQLHHAIGEEFLLVTPQTIQFNLASDHFLDIAQYTTMIAECETHRHRSPLTCRACNDRLQCATDLYGDAFLADFFLKDSTPFEEWALVKREQLARMALSALERLAAYHTRRRDYVSMERTARQQIAIDSFRESAHQGLMRALAWSGQRSKALAQYETYRQQLKSEFNIEPSHAMTELFEQIRDEKLEQPSVPLISNVPLPLTNFVGREREIAQAQQLLVTARLLTMTGAGGCGKTRLAMEVARNLSDEFTEGAWFVELAAINDPTLVMPSIAATLGIREQPGSALLDQIIDQVRAKQLLLILDNCEHLLEACAQFAESFLRAVPQAQLLVTSRESLDITGELVYRVPSLEIPQCHLTALELAQIDSVELFVTRAQAVQPEFQLTNTNASAIVSICQQLDGIPLAIELAAARVKALSVEEIEHHLTDRFQLLVGGSRTALPRYKTLRATLDWSHALLSEPECILFRRLSIFAGGFTLEAVKAICGGDGVEPKQMLTALSGLVDKSLVMSNQASSGARFHIHESTRQYARIKLMESGDETETCHRHLDFFCRLAETLEPDTVGAKSAGTFDRLAKENSNLRAALEWSTTDVGDAQTGLRLAASLDKLWEQQGLLVEGHNWLGKLLARAGATAPPALRAKALYGYGQTAYFLHDPVTARSYYEQSLALDREVDNQSGIARTLTRLGFLCGTQREYGTALAFLQEGLAMYRVLGDLTGVTEALVCMGHMTLRLRDVAQARSLTEESLVLARRVDDPDQEARSTWTLGHIALLEGNYAQARSWYSEAITILRSRGHLWGVLFLLDAFGRLAVAEHQFERAVRLFGTTKHLGEKIGTSLPPTEQVEHDQAESAARSALGEDEFTAAWADGRSMTIERTIAFTQENPQHA